MLSAQDSGSPLEDHLLRNFRKYAHRDAAPGDSIWNGDRPEKVYPDAHI